MNAIARHARRWRNQLNKWLVQFQNSYLRNARVLGYPFQVTLEPGNLCNLKCPLCATTFRESAIPKGMLSFDNAKKILDRFPYAVQLILSNWGEPLLNKDIFRIIRYAKQRDLNVRMESNLTLLTTEECEQLVISGLDTLVVALDGVSQETYEKYRVGGQVADVIANVKKIREAQARMENHRTTLEWKMVINQYNQEEVEQARQQAQELGMTFSAVTIWVPEDQQDWLPKNPAHMGVRNQKGAPAKCHNLWQSVSVNFNGDLFPCCSEFTPEDRLLNVIQDPYESIWNSEEYQKRRRLNRGPVNCDDCHKNKSTQWYQMWLAGKTDRHSGPPSGVS